MADGFVFGVDEEYQAYLAQTIIKNFHLIWVGVSSTADFYLGPFWTYLTSALLYLSKGEPLFTGYFAAVLGSVTTLVIFLIGNKLYGYLTAILAAVLYSCLPLVVYFDQKYWNVSLIPLLSLILLFSMFSSFRNKSWWLVFAFAYGLVFHTHLSIAPYGMIALVLVFLQRKKIPLKTCFLSILVFVAVVSPLIVFDYFHKGSNITFPLRLVNNSKQEARQLSIMYKTVFLSQTLGRLVYLEPFRDSADETNWGCTSISNAKYFQNKSNSYWQKVDTLTSRTKPSPVLSSCLLAILVWFLTRWRLWRKDNFRILLMTILTYLICFFFFPGDAYEYYLVGFFPLFLFIPGILLNNAGFRRKILVIGVIVVFSLMGIRTVISSTHNYGLQVKKELIKAVSNIVGNQSFELRSEGMCHIAEGWRYLFSLYGQKPIRSSTDQIFGWLYPEEILKNDVKFLVVMSESRAPLDFTNSQSMVLTGGGFTAYVYEK